MKEHITPDRVANDIRMLHTSRNCAFLVVEGSDDARWFRSLCEKESCGIVVACGKHNAVEAIGILDRDGFRGALAIVDADFDCVLGEPTPSRNVLHTDQHDLTCMMLSSTALDKVLAEFAVPERLATFLETRGGPLGDHLARHAMPLGYLLMVSLRDDLGLDFEDLSFGKFVVEETLAIDVPEMIKTVLDKSQKHNLDSASLKRDISHLSAKSHDPWQVSRGPDIVAILSIGFRKTLVSRRQKDISPGEIERALRLAYGFAQFVESRLYESILQWQRDNTPYRVIASENG